MGIALAAPMSAAAVSQHSRPRPLHSAHAAHVTSVADSAQLQLAVPALHMSAGQQFQASVESRTPLVAGTTVHLSLTGSAGTAAQLSFPWPAGSFFALSPPLTLPAVRRGEREVRLRVMVEKPAGDGPSLSASLTLHVEPPLPTLAGQGVAFAAVRLSPSLTEWLRQHDLAVSALAAQAPLIVLGDARQPLATYREIWRQVAAGASALLLAPPPPDWSARWPFSVRLMPAALCPAEPFPQGTPRLTQDLSGAERGAMQDFFREQRDWAFDLGAEREATLRALNGRLLPHTGNSCRTLFGFRYGRGWVTVSSLPLLDHVADVWARRYLVRLIQQAADPAPAVRHLAATPGLAAWHASRLAALVEPAATITSFYDPRPAPVSHLRLMPEWSGARFACSPLEPRPWGQQLEIQWSTRAAAGSASAQASLELRFAVRVNSGQLQYKQADGSWQTAPRAAAGSDSKAVSIPLASAAAGQVWLRWPEPPGSQQLCQVHLTR